MRAGGAQSKWSWESRSPRGADNSPPRSRTSDIAAGYIVRDPADGLLGVVVLLAQLGVVGLSEGLDAAQPSHDRGPHVHVGLLVGDEVNGSLAGRVPQHGVPGSSGQRDIVDWVEPRLRSEGVPVALHHRQGQDVGVEVAVVELSEWRC